MMTENSFLDELAYPFKYLERPSVSVCKCVAGDYEIKVK